MKIIHLSVVSHGQGHIVHQLLDDLKSSGLTNAIHVTLTLNIHEVLPFSLASFPFLIKVIRNSESKGFGANHNAAFYKYQKDLDFFCVINPDVRFNQNPFPALLAYLESSNIGLAAPVVLGKDGLIEDSARFFPTPFKILCKALGGCEGNDYVIKNELICPEWVGGMFMLFPQEVFRAVNGFNERFFLYYEDVDICARLKFLGYKVILCPDAKVVHNAQRSSHSSLKYLKWHLTSMLCFFCSKVFLQIYWKKIRSTFVKDEIV